MNAAQLEQIVRGIPSGAAPAGVCWQCRHDAEGLIPHLRGFRIATSEACLLYEASMERWLIGEGYHRFEWGNGETPTVTLDLYDKHYEDRSEHDSIVKLLSLACKDIGESLEVGNG